MTNPDLMFITDIAKKLTYEILIHSQQKLVPSYTAVPDSTDPDLSFMRTPYNLLTKKTGGELYGSLTIKMPSKRKRVQLLADLFWKQSRKKIVSHSQ